MMNNILTKYEESILEKILFEFDFVKNKSQEDKAFDNCSDYFLTIIRRALYQKIDEFKSHPNNKQNKIKNELIRINIPDFILNDVSITLILELTVNKYEFIKKIKTGKINSILMNGNELRIDLNFKNLKTGHEKHFQQNGTNPKDGN